MKRHNRLESVRTLAPFPDEIEEFQMMFPDIWEAGKGPAEPRINPNDIQNMMARLPLRKSSKLLRPDHELDMGTLAPAQPASQNGMMQLLPMMQAFSEFMH